MATPAYGVEGVEGNSGGAVYLWSALEVGMVMVSGEGTDRGMRYFSLPDI